MSTLPIRRIILYKHGVGYFERRGEVAGTTLQLSFPREAMDDMLKSLVALDRGAGQVLSIDFETPEDRATLLARGSINLSNDHTLLDLIRDLRGRQVRCLVRAYDELKERYVPGEEVEGIVVGAEYTSAEDAFQMPTPTLSIYDPERQRVQVIGLDALYHLEILDDKATADLDYFLRASQSEEDRRSATLHLSEGEHDLLVGYIAPAPAWRVSYRMLFEAGEADSTSESTVLLQGWGLFDNQLEEDLEDVHLTLVAGMPVSFRYRLYEPKIPRRPLVEDEERTVSAPMFYDAAPPPAPAPAAPKMARSRSMAAMPAEMDMMMADIAEEKEAEDAVMGQGMAFSAADMEESLQVAASGSERGSLFAYDVAHPVSVGRGQSAMVPIVGQRMPCRRDLLYNRYKLPDHPVASLRMQNETGLTLERGPVTVLEDGAYAGEAVVPFTPADGEVIVPFAVELGIKVEEKHSSERHIVSIRVRGDYLLIQEYDIQHTTYHLTSTLAKPVDVTIEHVCRSNYELTDTAEPAEQSASFARWTVACAANTRTVFAVHERRQVSRREQVRSLSGKQLQHYLHNRWLDAATGKELDRVLNIYHQIGEAQQQNSRLDREREGIYKQQRQIQGNLAPLGNEGEEGALRARYVAELNRLEDRLASLETQQQQIRQQIEALEQQARERLQALS